MLELVLGGVLERSWDGFGGVLGCLGGVLGRLGGVLGRLGAVLGASWGVLGADGSTSNMILVSGVGFGGVLVATDGVSRGGRRKRVGQSKGQSRPFLTQGSEHAQATLAGHGPADLEASATAADPFSL